MTNFWWGRPKWFSLTSFTTFIFSKRIFYICAWSNGVTKRWNSHEHKSVFAFSALCNILNFSYRLINETNRACIYWIKICYTSLQKEATCGGCGNSWHVQKRSLRFYVQEGSYMWWVWDLSACSERVPTSYAQELPWQHFSPKKEFSISFFVFTYSDYPRTDLPSFIQ